MQEDMRQAILVFVTQKEILVFGFLMFSWRQYSKVDMFTLLKSIFPHRANHLKFREFVSILRNKKRARWLFWLIREN